MPKTIALNEISKKIRGCFGSADLKFALHPSDKAVAENLKEIAKNSNLTYNDVYIAIRPVIDKWLSTDYCGFGENKGRPLTNNKVSLDTKVDRLTAEAALYISS